MSFSGIGARLYHGKGREGGGRGVDGVDVVVKVEGRSVVVINDDNMVVSDELAGCC